MKRTSIRALGLRFPALSSPGREVEGEGEVRLLGQGRSLRGLREEEEEEEEVEERWEEEVERR